MAITGGSSSLVEPLGVHGFGCHWAGFGGSPFSSVPRKELLCAFVASPAPPVPCQCHIQLQLVSPRANRWVKKKEKKIISCSSFELLWMFFPVPEARTLLLLLLWLFIKSFPALDPEAAFPGLERVCEENRAGVGCSHPGCPQPDTTPSTKSLCGKIRTISSQECLWRKKPFRS